MRLSGLKQKKLFICGPSLNVISFVLVLDFRAMLNSNEYDY